MPPRFVYRRDVLDALAVHGVAPRDDTRPALVHDFVSDLYRYEIRRLRDRLRRAEFPKQEYAGRVIELRRRYRVISVRAGDWVEDATPRTRP